MARLILIAGLPGSGKTTYGDKLAAKLGTKNYVDDYHAKAKDNSPNFINGRKYNELIEGLKNEELWIASDIEWCRPKKRREAETAVRKAVPHIHIEWLFLAIDENTCRQRVLQRCRSSAPNELSKIDELLCEYHVPLDSRIVSSDDDFEN
jgi:adenylate kinase family enzyme